MVIDMYSRNARDSRDEYEEMSDEEYEIYKYNIPPRYDGSRFRNGGRQRGKNGGRYSGGRNENDGCSDCSRLPANACSRDRGRGSKADCHSADISSPADSVCSSEGCSASDRHVYSDNWSERGARRFGRQSGGGEDIMCRAEPEPEPCEREALGESHEARAADPVNHAEDECHSFKEKDSAQNSDAEHQSECGRGGILGGLHLGNDELLILALIFIISSENECRDDIILFLALLLLAGG